MTLYISIELVLEIHDEQIEKFGGSRGIRDMGLLESALSRPQNGYYPDLIAEAAALWESLAQNHPFIDGNKRAAFAVTHIFLLVNGKTLTASADDAYAFIMGLYKTASFDFDRLDAWLRANTA